jgi:hypothetical protein
MASIQTTEPTSIQAGDTLAWRREDLSTDYPASSGWALSYRIVNASGKFDISATADGAYFAILVAASTTASYTPGPYAWAAVVTKTTERYTVGTGQLTVLANLNAAATADTRTSARKALDSVNAALETYGAKAYVQDIQVGDRIQRFFSPGDFLGFRNRLMIEVAREEAAARLAAGLAPKNRLLVRFR